MPELLERRKQHLVQQFETLPAELKRWTDLTAAGGTFEKHHSQIKAVSRQMVDLNDKVRKGWKESALEPFDAVRLAEAQCAAVHSIWNFFREKLLLRLDARFGVYLKAADAYAWACYQPLMIDRKKKNEKRTYREPPLVTFNSDVSPWALARESRYDVEPDETGTNRAEVFRRVSEALPIPIIGIPWQSEGFLPGMAAVAHETGHVVDSDFLMEAAIAPSVATALKDSTLQPAWSKHWWREVFADLFACWVAGPAFVWALADVVPESPGTVATKKRPSGADSKTWGRYPPGTLRMLLNMAALQELGFTQEADKIRDYWKADYPAHAMSSFEGDVEIVAKTVYQAGAIPASLDYRALVQSNEEYNVRSRVFERKEKLPELDVYNPRALVGAASSASRQPEYQQRLPEGFTHLVQVMAKRPPGQLDLPRDSEPGALKTQEIFDLLLGGLDAIEA